MHNEISDSQTIFSMNMKFQGSMYMELDISGKIFTSNQKILCRGSTMRCVLPVATF